MSEEGPNFNGISDLNTVSMGGNLFDLGEKVGFSSVSSPNIKKPNKRLEEMARRLGMMATLGTVTLSPLEGDGFDKPRRLDTRELIIDVPEIKDVFYIEPPERENYNFKNTEFSENLSLGRLIKNISYNKSEEYIINEKFEPLPLNSISEIFFDRSSIINGLSQYRRRYDTREKYRSGFAPVTLDELRRAEQKTALRERAAHRFRSQRMRRGVMGTVQTWLQERTDVKAGVSAMVRRAKDLIKGTVIGKQRHRAYTPLIAGMMSETEGRKMLMGSLDAEVAAETADLKAEAMTEDGLVTDVLLIGAGVQSAILASQLRSRRPEARIVAIDQADSIGGQFRSYGERPVFFINSRNFRPQKNDEVGLPGKDGNLNSFGSQAPVQVTDVSTETYPTNLELGDTAALNLFMSAETMLGATFEDVHELPDGSYEITLNDKDTGNPMTVRAKKVIVMTGAGERSALVEKQQPNLFSAEDIFRHFGNSENLFPMDLFKDKRVVIVGGGDTGRVIAELLTRLGPKEAYGKSLVQLEGPKSISWYGTEFKDRDGFCDSNRPRYQRVASFIEKSPGDGSLITPNIDKVREVETINGRLLITTNGGKQEEADIVIDATTLTSTALDALRNIAGTPREVNGYLTEIGDSAAVGRKLGRGIYLGGPVARLPLTAKEKSTFAQGIKENTLAIWANSIRTQALAKEVDLALQSDERFPVKF